MKRVLFMVVALALVVISVVTSCKKGAVYMNSATITGQDNAVCSCCGGYFITIHGTSDESAKVAALPLLSGFNPTYPKFPVEVYINWHRDASSCNPNEIIIDAAQVKQ